MDGLRTKHEDGFTLIELLVVILIIAILAAIAIPVFLRQREKAWASQVQSALKNAGTAIESYGTDTGGTFGALDGADSASDNAAYALLRDNGLQEVEHCRDHGRIACPRHRLLRDRHTLTAPRGRRLADRGVQQQRRLACAFRLRRLLNTVK